MIKFIRWTVIIFAVITFAGTLYSLLRGGMNIQITLVIFLLTIIYGYINRKRTESPAFPWREFSQFIYPGLTSVWIFINYGWLWAITTLVLVMISGTILADIFRYIGLKRLAKKLGVARWSGSKNIYKDKDFKRIYDIQHKIKRNHK